jgi:dTDP-4-amino-4,6-dideoxygalactose transaminase
LKGGKALRESFLPFSPPTIGEEEITEVVDTLRSDWITTGPKTKRFEEEFAAAVGAPAALGLNSCTAALHVALATLGIGSGDVVITTPMTFCSTVHVIEQVGARPVLVDIDPATLNIDPIKIQEAIKRLDEQPGVCGTVKAILPVHLYGHPCGMDVILETAKRYGLSIIEDAAHALPAKYKGRTIGSLGNNSGVRILTCFSFYATKNMTTGEGGMLTGPPDLLEEARIWSLHGMSRDAWRRYSSEGAWYYEVNRPGFKYNMTDIQAAIGLHQLRKLPAFHARRREIAKRYNAAFSQLEGFELPVENEDVEHAWHLYVLRVRADVLGLSRNDFIRQLHNRNIGSSVHFIPIHMHPFYRDKYAFQPRQFPVTYSEFQKIVSLPISPRMTDHDIQDVIEAVCDIALNARITDESAGEPSSARFS